VQPTTLEERAFNVAVVIFALVTSSFVWLGLPFFFVICLKGIDFLQPGITWN
jgi:hypothetical protein